MIIYEIRTDSNSTVGIATADKKRAENTVRELNRVAKEANNGMRFHTSELNLDDNVYEQQIAWWMSLFGAVRPKKKGSK